MALVETGRGGSISTGRNGLGAIASAGRGGKVFPGGCADAGAGRGVMEGGGAGWPATAEPQTAISRAVKSSRRR